MEVRLAIGIQMADGVATTVELKEMDGYCRQIITDKQYRHNSSKMTTALLMHCVTKIGNAKPTESDIRRMFVVDRNLLIMNLQILSVGAEVPGKYACKWCDEAFTVIEDLNNLTVTVATEYLDKVAVELKRGFTAADGVVHKAVELRIPTGIDEEVTSPILRSNYGEWCNVILARTVAKFGTLDMERFAGTGVKIIQSLNVKDLDQMVEAITINLPGFNLKHELSCKVCGKSELYSLDMSSFF